MKNCIHPSCSNKMYQQREAAKSEFQLCKYHEDEFKGKSEWSCSWCDAQHEQMINLIEDQRMKWGEL